MKGPLSFLVGHIRDVHCLASLREKRFSPHSASIYLWLTSADICSAHARTRTYCTQAGFALIPDCFGFCGGLLRLPFKLLPNQCVSVWPRVCVEIWWFSVSGGNSTVSAAIISLLFHRLSSFPCLLSDTGISLFSGSRAETSSYRSEDSPALIPAWLFIGQTTPVYAVLISQCVKAKGRSQNQVTHFT